MPDSDSEAAGTTVYRLAGLSIVGEVALPGLAVSCEPTIEGAVTVRRAAIPARPSSSADFPQIGSYQGELVLDIPEVARFLIRNHREILVDQAPSSDDGDVRSYLLGTVFGLLCHQRGILPLHASAIDVDGGCIAFVGASGDGKSTLAGALAGRGHQVISDDVLFLRQDEDGPIQAWPGIGRLRLWEDSLAALGCGGPGIEREFRGYDKYLVPLPPPKQPTEPRRLLRVYRLDTATNGGGAGIARVRGAAAIELLMQNVYRLELAERLGHKPAAFGLCASAASQVPVFQFARAWRLDALEQGVDCLEDHLRNAC